MARRNYKFTNKRHPVQALAGTILGAISILGMGAVIYAAFLEQGGTKPGYGLTGLLAVIFSLVGMVLGIRSFRENDCYHVFSWIGTVINVLVLVGLGFLYAWGIQ